LRRVLSTPARVDPLDDMRLAMTAMNARAQRRVPIASGALLAHFC
jgi:hypothetical protein